MFFSKKTEIKSPMNGKLINITDVKDEAFSSKALGDGVAIIPSDGGVYAPIDGEIVTVIESNHAVGIQTKNGIEILIHIGQDTVKLKGKYFKSYVKEGDKVKAGTLLIEFDKENIEKENYDIVSPIVITNTENCKSIVAESPRDIKVGDKILTIEK